MHGSGQAMIIENGVYYTREQWTQKQVLEKLTAIETHLSALVDVLRTQKQ